VLKTIRGALFNIYGVSDLGFIGLIDYQLEVRKHLLNLKYNSNFTNDFCAATSGEMHRATMNWLQYREQKGDNVDYDILNLWSGKFLKGIFALKQKHASKFLE